MSETGEVSANVLKQKRLNGLIGRKYSFLRNRMICIMPLGAESSTRDEFLIRNTRDAAKVDRLIQKGMRSRKSQNGLQNRKTMKTEKSVKVRPGHIKNVFSDADKSKRKVSNGKTNRKVS